MKIHPYIRIYSILLMSLMCVLGASSLVYGDSLQAELRNKANHNLTNGIWFGTNNMALGSPNPFLAPGQYVSIKYSVDHPTDLWNIQIYTRNTNYSGTGSKGGLLNRTDHGKKFPLLWQVYDQVQTNAGPCTNLLEWGVILDRLDASWSLDNPDYYLAQSMSNKARLAPYPVSNRISLITNGLYLYFNADARLALTKSMNGTYETTVYVDFNHYLLPVLELDSVLPAKGYSSERKVILTLTGDHFKPGAQVKLVRTAGEEISGNIKSLASDLITCEFDLTQAQHPGYYDLLVINPDSQSSSLPQGFLIQGYDMTGNKLVPVNNFYLARPNSYVNIKWSIEKPGKVFLKICNSSGEVVKTIMDEAFLDAGSYQFDWDATSDSSRKVASGIYFLKIKSGDFSDVKKIVVVR